MRQSQLDGSTLDSREKRISKLGQLKGNPHIDLETNLEGYIISGYTSSNSQYGLAIFTPHSKGKYTFQTNYNSTNNEIISGNLSVNGNNYDLFWANKADLDYAEITYRVQGNSPEIVKLDASNNKILCSEAPYKDYSVEVVFFDIHGNRYE